MNKRILSVGQCDADHGFLAHTFSQAFGAEVVAADSYKDAVDQLRRDSFALILVNRLLDADGSSGVEVIRKLKADKSVAAVPVMLVSNHEDAQAQAVQVGAVPGFGKGVLGRPPALDKVRPFLETVFKS